MSPRDGDDVLDLVLGKLEGVRKQGGRWMARCPAHEDNTPSLSIARGTEQPVVLKCQAGCETADVLAGIGLTMEDISVPRDERQPAEEWTPRGPAVAVYRYVDESGTLLFEVCRTAGKEFPQRHPDPASRSGWKWSTAGIRRVPYRLPKLISGVREGKRIFVVEGEKDVHAIEAAGGVATCNPGGAGKWRSEYSPHFEGADVTIVRDNDEPGRKHARDVAAHLSKVAKSVVIVEAADGKDAADHLAAGHGLDAFKQLERAQTVTAETWEDLVPLGTRAPLPAFPVETLPDYIAVMVTAVATEVQVPADLPGALAMGVLSTAAGGRAELVVRGQWREPLNLYLATAMPPGSGKSPAFRLMCAPIFAAEKELRETAKDRIMAMVIEREAAIAEAEALRRKAKAPEDIRDAVQAASMAEALAVPVMPRLTADDVVPEQAATIMAEQEGRLAILSAEGTFFSVIMGRYSNGTPNVELALKGHAGDRVQVDRRGRAELIERPALTIATTVQPTVLREIAAKPAMRERGVLARFLMSLPPDLVGNRLITPDLVPDDVLRDYTEMVKSLITRMAGWTDPAVIQLTPAALKLHTEWRAEIEPRLKQGTGDLEALRDWASKLPGATARLAGLLHLAEKPENGPRIPVEEETMARAILQARYWAEHAMAAFGAMRAHPAIEDARAVLEWIRSRAEPAKFFTQRDVHRALLRRFATAPDAACALDVLEDHGYVRRVDVPRGPGRKPVIYDVHPRAVTN